VVLWSAADFDHVMRVAPKTSLDLMAEVRAFTAQVRLILAGATPEAAAAWVEHNSGG
jgi:hypothetical protein